MNRSVSIAKRSVQSISASIALLCCSFNAHAYEGDYLYLAVEGGASFSQKVKINPPSPWDPSVDGYNKKLRNSEVLGLGIGYHLCPMISAELILDHRNSFKYKKFQNAATALGNKFRFFNLRNTTVMANFIGYGGGMFDCLNYQCNNFTMDPFINAGIGVSYNTLDNFHSLQVNGGKAFSIMNPYTKTSLAYQFGLGVQITTCDLVGIGLGYRYLGAGKIRSNDYLIDNPDAVTLTSGVATPTWSGRLKTNELYVKLIFFIN